MLRLNNLHLAHFMCITEADLDFNANCVIIEGDNGQGKSAIMEAVAICLSERKRSDSVKEFVQKGFEHAKIILDLTYNGEDIHFDVNLNLKGGTPLERDVTYKGKHYINSEVTTLINDLEFTFYSDIIISMQGADDIATMTPTQRLNLLQKLFQFDFTEQIKPIETKIDEAIQSKTVNAEKIDFLEKANIKNQSTLDGLVEKEYTFSKEEYDNYKKELSEKQQKLDASNDALEKSNRSLQEKAKMENKVNSLENERKTLIKQLEESRKAQDELNEFDCQGKAVVINNDINIIKEVCNKATDDIHSKKELLEKLRSDRSLKSETLGTLKANNAIILKKFKLIESGICPECGQSTHNLHTEQLEKDKTENETQLKIFSDNILNIGQEEKRIQDEIAQLREAVNDANTDIAHKESELKSVYDNYTRIASRVLSSEKLEELNNKIKEIDDDILKCREVIDANNKLLQETEQLTLQRSQLKDEVKQIADKIKEADEVHDHNKIVNIQRASIKNNISENENIIKELKNSISQTDVDIQVYNEVLKVLDKELPNYLVVKTCARLEQEMNNFVNIVFPSFRLRLLQSRRGVEFFYTTDLNIDMTDLKKLINSKMASGYERSVLGLAFKVALCKAYGLSFIALDEIDAAASEGNSVLTMESLISSNTFNQIFFITHKEATRDVIKSLCDSVVSYHVDKGVFSNEEAD